MLLGRGKPAAAAPHRRHLPSLSLPLSGPAKLLPCQNCCFLHPPPQVMTNMRPKTYFLRPDVALPLGFALLREIWQQKVRLGLQRGGVGVL